MDRVELCNKGYNFVRSSTKPGKVLAMPKGQQMKDSPTCILFDMSREHGKFKGFKIKFPQDAYHNSNTAVEETHTVFVNRVIIVAESCIFTDSARLEMVLTRVSGDQVKEQFNLASWIPVRGYTLACSPTHLVFVGGYVTNSQNLEECSNELQVMLLEDFSQGRLQKLRLNTARRSPAVAFGNL